jgi:NADH-quinone oxidoreductase subunit J
MNPFGLLLTATILTAVGFWLMLPRGMARGRWLGGLLTAVGLGITASQAMSFGEAGASAIYYLLAGITVLAAVATVTSASPVYAAIWFAITLLGSAGVFMFQGSQFLGVATVVVYAGAILVTFLFVLMLAQPGGKASYDRVSWEAPLSAAAGALMIGVLTLAIVGVFQHPLEADHAEARRTPEALANNILAEEHMARLGAQLFSKQLISVEIAGTLLLVGLVGCVAIVIHMHSEPPKATPASRASGLLASGPADGIMAAIEMSGIQVSGPGGTVSVTELSITRAHGAGGSSHE